MKNSAEPRGLEQVRSENDQLRKKRIDDVHKHYPDLAEKTEKIQKLVRENLLKSVFIKKDVEDNGRPELSLEEYTAIIEQLKQERFALIKKYCIDPEYDRHIYSCEKCKDIGISPDGKTCECEVLRRKRIRLYKNFRDSGLSPVQLKETFKSFNIEYYSDNSLIRDNSSTMSEHIRGIVIRSKKFARDCITGKSPRGLYFYGLPGRGKTFLANCIANEILSCQIPLLYKKYDKLIAQIQETYSSSENTSELIQLITNVDVLILDDLGVEKPSDDAGSKLYQIIDGRLAQGLPTVITSNFSLGELGNRYADTMLGKRIASRIAELCQACEIFSEYDIRIVKNSHLSEEE